ncbi:hypothetical protein [Bacillus sp. FJAT-49736]|uniref:hypothetical protein n=1 Tax=Bacillus sp. FJAT-49736 TaxID=2833582 RepID=UPI001BCA1D49|nr:hypothetical protein [Bacillus sp. FJAT-49736]MBS4172721.1 hypothetical protein [Bacillus sp. FJAT-49736]
MFFFIYSDFISKFSATKSKNIMDEFERVESKHTRIRFDHDIHEIIMCLHR